MSEGDQLFGKALLSVDSLILKHAHDGIGYIHDFKVMGLGQFGAAPGGKIEVANLLTQDSPLYNGIVKRDMQRAGGRFPENRAGNHFPAAVKKVVADNDDGVGNAIHFENVALFDRLHHHTSLPTGSAAGSSSER